MAMKLFDSKLEMVKMVSVAILINITVNLLKLVNTCAYKSTPRYLNVREIQLAQVKILQKFWSC